MLSHTTQHDTQIQIVPSHTTQPDTQIQTLNATDIACHKCEPGAVLSHTMQHDTQIQTLHVIAMNLGWVLFHTCLLYTSPSPRDWLESRMPSSA